VSSLSFLLTHDSEQTLPFNRATSVSAPESMWHALQCVPRDDSDKEDIHIKHLDFERDDSIDGDDNLEHAVTVERNGACMDVTWTLILWKAPAQGGEESLPQQAEAAELDYNLVASAAVSTSSRWPTILPFLCVAVPARGITSPCCTIVVALELFSLVIDIHRYHGFNHPLFREQHLTPQVINLLLECQAETLHSEIVEHLHSSSPSGFEKALIGTSAAEGEPSMSSFAVGREAV
jgi:hypothetical protein